MIRSDSIAFVLLLPGIFLQLSACTSGKESGDASTDEADADTDSDSDSDADSDSDSDADADLSATSQGGLYQMTYTTDPSPPQSGATTLLFSLMDSSGVAVTGASLEVTPWMPAMGHGINDKPVVTQVGQGAYTAAWEYSMGGDWEVEIAVEAAPGIDTFVLPFVVGGM